MILAEHIPRILPRDTASTWETIASIDLEDAFRAKEARNESRVWA